MSNKHSRLITVLGLPGIGKTSLVRNTLVHIEERGLLTGGAISIKCQYITSIEQFLTKFLSEL